MATYTYKVQLIYQHSARKRTIYTRLSLEEAQRICGNPETSSRTCTSSAGRRRTKLRGPWFYGFTEE